MLLGEILKRRDARVLDIACGTGDLAIELSIGADASILGTDFCRPMLEIAIKKTDGVAFVESDALRLPFEDKMFDAATIGFGLRNLSNHREGLREIHRILKPGGKAVVLEFSTPVAPGVRQAFRFYFSNVLPLIGGFISGDRGAYRYLPASVERFPDQKELATDMADAGFGNVEYTNLSGGIAAIHTGIRPSDDN